MSKKPKLEWYAGIALGLLIGMGGAFTLFFIVDYYRAAGLRLSNDEWFGFAINAVTIFFSAALAATALWGVKQQIQHNLDLEEERRLAKLAALEARFTKALNNISAVCTSHARVYAYGRDTEEKGDKYVLDDVDRDTLESVIEHSRHNVRRDLQDLLKLYDYVIVKFNRINVQDTDRMPAFKTDLDRRLDLFAYEHWASLCSKADVFIHYAKIGKYERSPELIRKTLIGFFNLTKRGTLYVRPTASGTIHRSPPSINDFIDKMIDEKLHELKLGSNNALPFQGFDMKF